MVTRVLWFLPRLGGGGAESHTVRVINALDSACLHSSVAVARGGGEYESRLRAAEVHRLTDVPERGSSTLSLWRAGLPLRRLVERERPDVVCSVMGHANALTLWALREVQHPARVVLCVQNNPRRAYGGWSPLHAWVRHAMRTQYSRADAVIALSRGVAQVLEQIAPAIAGRIEVIPNAAVDPALLSARGAACPRARPQGKLLVACGRLNEQKGYPVLLRALARLQRYEPAYLWILGQGPLQASLERLARKLGVHERVWFAGFLPDPYPFIAAADAFVLSSLYEGFGNVLVEAMACGVPVVSSDCPYGPAEIIEHDSTGLLTPVGDAAALAAALHRVLSDGALADRLRVAGAQRAQAFSDQVVAARYGALFQRVVAATK